MGNAFGFFFLPFWKARQAKSLPYLYGLKPRCGRMAGMWVNTSQLCLLMLLPKRRDLAPAHYSGTRMLLDSQPDRLKRALM